MFAAAVAVCDADASSVTVSVLVARLVLKCSTTVVVSEAFGVAVQTDEAGTVTVKLQVVAAASEHDPVALQGFPEPAEHAL